MRLTTADPPMHQRILAALLVLLIAWPTKSRGAPVDEEGYVHIGGIDQWIQISGTDARNPVLLWLNGGPGGSIRRPDES